MTEFELEQCINEYGRDIYSFCKHLTGNRQDADDLYQDTFLKALELQRKIRWEENPKSYLLSVAVRVEHTVQVLSVDEEGYLNVAPYEIEGRGGSGECSILASWLFEDLEYGMIDRFGYIHSGTLDSLRVETFTKNEDGT